MVLMLDEDLEPGVPAQQRMPHQGCRPDHAIDSFACGVYVIERRQQHGKHQCTFGPVASEGVRLTRRNGVSILQTDGRYFMALLRVARPGMNHTALGCVIAGALLSLFPAATVS